MRTCILQTQTRMPGEHLLVCDANVNVYVKQQGDVNTVPVAYGTSDFQPAS